MAEKFWPENLGIEGFCPVPEKEEKHRIIKVGKDPKMKSNRQPNPTMPAKPCPEVPHLHAL